MRRGAAILIAGAASVSLSGCAATVAPRTGADAGVADQGGAAPKQPLPGSAVAPSAAAPSALPAGGAVEPGIQYLYGSGEAAALSLQAYRGLIDLVVAKAGDRSAGRPIASVVLAPDATLARPRFETCGDKPLAVMLDIDETALLNLGYESDDARRGGAFDAGRWDRWEKTGARAVEPVPGMAQLALIAKINKVTLVFNSNRLAANAAQTEAALGGAGLGPVHHLRNLWLQGDAGTGSGKDMRRQAIAARFCVIAMVGDQLGDFSDLFNAPGLDPRQRRAAAMAREVEALWGHGWFVLPNPVYGTGLQGGYDQIFPADKRWTDPGGAAVPPPSPEAKP